MDLCAQVRNRLLLRDYDPMRCSGMQQSVQRSKTYIVVGGRQRSVVD